MRVLMPEELIEGGVYRLEPNENYSKSRDKIWYEIKVINQYSNEIEFRIMNSNAEHTEGRTVLFGHSHAIFNVRDVYCLVEFRDNEANLRRREADFERASQQPRPIRTYGMSPEFKKVLIDLALFEKDENWFKELTTV